MAGYHQHSTRVDLVEAKNRITKKLGALKAEKYFNLINRFFSKKLNTSDFHKLCIVAIGRENINLHNFFIKSVLKNATFSTTQPPNPSKPDVSANRKPVNGYQISCLQSLYSYNLIPKSPRRGRTPVVHSRKKYKDRPSPLGPHGKPETMMCQEQKSGIINVEDEEVNQTAGIDSKRPITAPFGVEYRAKVAYKWVQVESCYNNGELPDTGSLMTRLDKQLKHEGVTVSLEFAKVLNLSLDMYLKRLMEPCLELAISQARAQSLLGLNGITQQHGRCVQRPSSYTCASLVDLRAAMELNATLLGENWPLHLETVALKLD